MRPIVFEDDLAQLLDQFEPSMLFEGSTPNDLKAWQDRFRSTLIDLLGNRPKRTDLSPEFLAETDCGNHIRYRIRYQTEPEVFDSHPTIGQNAPSPASEKPTKRLVP